MQKRLEAIQKRLGYQFRDQNLIIEALTHKSSKQPYNNERLEFLGDAVLDLIVGEYLYHEFTEVAEGELSKLRASLVNEKSFEKLARLLHLGEYIYISLAEENNNGREKPSLLSNAFEAIIGALYLEAGLEKARDLAVALLEEAYPKIDMDAIFRDHKTTLQELTQAHFGMTPEYRLVRSFGPDHKKEFEIAVSVRGRDLSVASGKSKKEAQQKAAMLALEILKKEVR
ncbi:MULTISPECIES: ribonuclease III [Sulfurospirillum]|uniref:Ribonuclease 3 n=3 Tax=Sulfurospirillum TaxID=57665 RepID=A0A1D7TMJ3_9BACT|nr:MULTISPECIES: ribonuclease III [Sulfurospirillum]AHJ13961.1 ribonuclease III [Sulfurospirillum multivorans DSM 12446]AOO66212.1 ribonuclease III [Sulfurospirillum halorespirans DSM 13726]QEH07449.1 ribonuclease III [Sulfurospirillum multivorans]